MKHLKQLNNKTAVAFAAVALLIIFGSCNEKSNKSDLVDTGTLAVTKFSLKHDTEHPGLDSVYFAIDLNHKVIYNADSLNPGTDISKLVPVITYSSGVDKATIIMEGGSTRTGEVDYKNHPTDSIDFSGKVTFNLTQGDKSISYTIKVNVHKEIGDSLCWNEAARTVLPSRLPEPVRQKSILLEDSTSVSLLLEKDGTYTWATTRNLPSGNWNKNAVTLSFVPEIASLTAAENDIYILDKDGNLYSRSLDSEWTPTGKVWKSLIGGYLKSVVGIREADNNLYFDRYPLTDNNILFNPCKIPDEFPIKDASNFVTLANKWTLSPVAFLTGGVTADGKLSAATWAFDGAEWICLNADSLPALKGAALIPYFYFRRSSAGTEAIRYNVWMLLGGTDADGETNRTVYISYDNGVNWAKASESMQLPEVIPAMTGCDNIVAKIPMSADLSANWTRVFIRRATRADYQLDGSTIRWDCPYIFLIGGYASDGTLYNTIWRGVLNRLTFIPII